MVVCSSRSCPVKDGRNEAIDDDSTLNVKTSLGRKKKGHKYKRSGAITIVPLTKVGVSGNSSCSTDRVAITIVPSANSSHVLRITKSLGLVGQMAR